MRPGLLTRFALVVALVHATQSSAQTPTTVDALLKQPVSPGSLALLIDHTTLPAVTHRIGEALSHQSPDVRAAAARVVFAGGLRELLPQLAAAVSAEQVADPAIEQIRTLRQLGGSEH